jgi:ATP-binding cassette, subfamily C (CFTR/MRP), member 1
MGLSNLLCSIIQAQRVEETCRMAKFRWCNLWQNVVQNIPYIVAPALTFAVYAIQALSQGKAAINTAQAFTSLSIITLLTDPTAKLLSAIPTTASTLGCFDRIQQFLISEKREDRRQTIPDYREDVTETDSRISSSTAVLMDQVDLRPALSADVLLRAVALSVPHGSLSMIIGAVGSGKTTLLRAILGEIAPEKGVIAVCSKRIAFCAQTPWLPNLTIRQAICGLPDSSLDVDEEWYQTIIHCCDLDRDMSSVAEGDRTCIGSGSTILSGGQKHRIALARALYSRNKIVILDDVLGALDAKTKGTVVERVLGKSGILKKLGITCIVATHSGMYSLHTVLPHRVGFFSETVHALMSCQRPYVKSQSALYTTNRVPLRC